MSERSAATQAHLTIDLAALVANWRFMAALASSAETSAVIKADAYGIGIEQAGRALAAAGCETFFVATLAEGEVLRQILPRPTVYVLDGLLKGTVDRFAAARLHPVVGSLPEVDEWLAFAGSSASTGCAIQIDTGMNRQGLSLDEAETLAGNADRLDALAPSLVMSHLACADDPGHPMNRRQLKLFEAASARLPGIRRSLANSAGTMLGSAYQFDLTRPGIALYGARAAHDQPPLRTVVTAEAEVLRVREAGAGETVGYGATATLKRASRLAVLAAGYADGYIRAAGSDGDRPSARVFIRDMEAPLVGRISMDLMVADVTAIDGVERGDRAELFGPHIAIDDVADRAGTIGYELLTNLGRRYTRSYRAS